MMIKPSAKYSVKRAGHNINNLSFSLDPVPSLVFNDLPLNSMTAMRLTLSKSHHPKAFLKISGMCFLGRSLMALPSYRVSV